MTAPKPQRASAAGALARGGARGDRLQSGVGVGTKQELKWHLICNGVYSWCECMCVDEVCRMHLSLSVCVCV